MTNGLKTIAVGFCWCCVCLLFSFVFPKSRISCVETPPSLFSHLLLIAISPLASFPWAFQVVLCLSSGHEEGIFMTKARVCPAESCRHSTVQAGEDSSSGHSRLTALNQNERNKSAL